MRNRENINTRRDQSFMWQLYCGQILVTLLAYYISLMQTHLANIYAKPIVFLDILLIRKSTPLNTRFIIVIKALL